MSYTPSSVDFAIARASASSTTSTCIPQTIDSFLGNVTDNAAQTCENIASRRTGQSDFWDHPGYHEFPYLSFAWDSQDKTQYGSWKLKPISVDHLCHQAVLNEIATRPSNLGYGLGYALRNMFNFFIEAKKGVRAFIAKNISSSAMSEKDKAPLLEQLKKEDDCIDATQELSERLQAVEKLEDIQEDCLVSEGMSRDKARETQFAQQPAGFQAHRHHWFGVDNAAYRARNHVCPEETSALLHAVYDAEKATKKQREKCKS